MPRGVYARTGFHRSAISAGCVKHGMTGTPEFTAWVNMIDRCTNPKHRYFKDYGGRGIAVCGRWRAFDSFFADMGPRPSALHTLERKDGNAGYGPDNCVWATRTEQARNRRSNLILTINGQSRCAAEWAELVGIKADTLRRRIYRGLSPEEAVCV